MSVGEQDLVMMKEEGSGGATVVLMLKIEGCATPGSSLPRFPRASERAGLLRDVNSTHRRAGLERAPNTHTTLQS